MQLGLEKCIRLNLTLSFFFFVQTSMKWKVHQKQIKHRWFFSNGTCTEKKFTVKLKVYIWTRRGTKKCKPQDGAFRRGLTGLFQLAVLMFLFLFGFFWKRWKSRDGTEVTAWVRVFVSWIRTVSGKPWKHRLLCDATLRCSITSPAVVELHTCDVVRKTRKTFHLCF